MSITKKPLSPATRARKTTRKRRSPEASRDNILGAAEALLVEHGPQALKLTDVAKKAGISHGTVLHHFGTIAEVQAALMERMVRQLVEQVLEAHAALPALPDGGMPATGPNILFDAFEQRGSARLAAWLELTGEASRLTLVRDAVGTVLASRNDRDAGTRSIVENRILVSIVLAVGVGLFGRSLAEALGRPPGTTRQLVLELLRGELPMMPAAAPLRR